MQLGLMIEGQEGLTWDLWKHLAELAEGLGFESLFRSDHVRSLAGVGDRDTIEAWTSLSYLAMATKRIRFGTLVSPMTFRHPSMLALQAAAVDALSGGRLDVGLGAGWNVPEHEAFGLPFPSVKTRLDMLEEAAQLVIALLEGKLASFKGEHYSLREALNSPQPVQKPHAPIIIGGKGEKRLLRIAARFADEWNIHGQTPESYRAKNAVFLRHCAEVGRDERQVKRSLMLGFIVGETDAELRDHVAAVRSRHPDAATDEAERNPELLRADAWLVGRPEQVSAQLKALEAEGISRVMMQHLALDYDAPVRLLGRAVIPAVA